MYWKTFPHHLPLHAQACWFLRLPANTSPLLANWDESNCEFHLAGQGWSVPWYLIRHWMPAQGDAQPRSYPAITNPNKWRRFPDYSPSEGQRVWYHAYDMGAAPIRGLYHVQDNTPWFGDEATGSLCPWQIVVKWRPEYVPTA